MKFEDFSIARSQILALHDVSEDEMKNNVDILKEWMLKEPNIPSELLQDSFLEISILNNKFSIEKTKRKIEQYCSMKASERYKYLFEYVPVPSEQNGFYMMIPQLTNNFHRIIIGKIRDEDKYSHSDDCRIFLLQSELAAHFDYNDGVIYVIEYSKCSANLISKFRLNVAVDCIKIFFEAMSGRVRAFHVINKNAKLLMSFFTPFLPKKITSKFHFHDDYESVKKLVPMKYLPKDIGGELKTFDEMLLDWDELYKENYDVIKAIRSIKAKGELRNPDSYSNELEGTFKKLNID